MGKTRRAGDVCRCVHGLVIVREVHDLALRNSDDYGVGIGDIEPWSAIEVEFLVITNAWSRLVWSPESGDKFLFGLARKFLLPEGVQHLTDAASVQRGEDKAVEQGIGQNRDDENDAEDNGALSCPRATASSPEGGVCHRENGGDRDHDGCDPEQQHDGVVVHFICIQRHGSGDPTPCGGYPGTDCWRNDFPF